MKKRLFLLVLLLDICILSLFSSGLSPLFSLSPTFSNTMTGVNGSVDEQAAVSSYKHYAELPPLLDMGFSLSTMYMDVVGIVDLHQQLSILPDDEGYLWFQPRSGLALDNNSPRVGFVEVRYKGFLGSMGRRELKWGPGTYDLGLSDNTPYYDGIWLQYRFDQDYGAWWYQFLATDFGGIYSSTAFPISKALFAHRFGFENRVVRATVSELAMNWDRTSTFLNIIPFGVWQSTAHETSNVMIEVTGEALLGSSRLYGSFIMNDSVVFGLQERNPIGLGGLLGFEWRFFDDLSIQDQRDFGLYENTFKSTQGGLTAGFECYYTSNYLYGSTNEAGTYTALLKQFAYGGALFGDSIAYYIGFPYGPGSLLSQALVSYEGNAFKVSGVLGLLIKNGASAATLYSEMTMSEFSLANSDYHLLFSVKGSYHLSESLQLMVLLKEDWNINKSSSDFLVSVGGSFNWMPSILL